MVERYEAVPAPNMSQPVQSLNEPVVDGVVNVSPTLDAPINESSEDASVGVSSQRIDEETLITNNIVEDIPAKVVERVNTPAEQERVYMYQNVLDKFAVNIRIYNGDPFSSLIRCSIRVGLITTQASRTPNFMYDYCRHYT